MDNLDLVAKKIKTLLNFKNDFNLTNSTVQIQIVFMDKLNNTKDKSYKVKYTSNTTNNTNHKSHRHENLEIHKKIQIGNRGK